MTRKSRMLLPRWLASAALAAALFSGPALGEVIWRGDFETGDLSQWDGIQAIEGRLQVVTDPVREGTYALGVEVRQGDDPISASGNRNELEKRLDCSEGQEHY
jgi:hypothetical protein